MKNICLYLLCLITLSGCKKYLDEKPDKSLATPSTLKDIRAMLDNNSIFNITSSQGEESADNYYLTETSFNALAVEQYRNTYIWAEDIHRAAVPNNWSNVFAAVYYSTLALHELHKIERTPANQAEYNELEGTAYFFRSRAYLQAVWTWAKAYDAASASTDLGIPLRPGIDFNETSVRATLADSYQQLLDDATTSADLLPIISAHPMRPTRIAAFAQLSRIFLSMRKYDKVKQYADSTLQYANTILDFNTLNASAAFPVPRYNAETIFYSYSNGTSILNASTAKVDSVLYNSYAANDLRKTIFYKSNGNSTFNYVGSYDGGTPLFTGTTTSEILLNRAEANAKLGNITEAMNDLNALLIKRWKKGTFIPFVANDKATAIKQIETERRKELVFRELRWIDIKRLNKEGAGITLTRKLGTNIYTLPPNDNRFALPFPLDVIQLSGMPQNPR